MTTPTIGVIFRPQLPPEQLRAVAQAADEAGLDELWLWEDCFRESGIACAAAALAWTQRVRVAVGLLPAPLRNVALTAMEVASLARMFPGRFKVAIGHGVQDWMGQTGARVESPMTLLREYLVALRSLLEGQTVTSSGRYVRLDNVALDWPPAAAPALLAGGTGPRTLALTGELADGTILTAGTTPEQVQQTRDLVAAASRAAGRTQRPHLTVYLMAASGPDADERMAAEVRASGLDPSDDISVTGDADALAAGIVRWVQAGADTVVLQPTDDEPDLAGFIRLVAEQVRPRVLAARG